MKIEKLFKKVEKYFNMDDEDSKKSEKTDKLIRDLNDKIESIKAKINVAVSKSKKTKLKKQLEALKEVRDKIWVKNEEDG